MYFIIARYKVDFDRLQQVIQKCTTHTHNSKSISIFFVYFVAENRSCSRFVVVCFAAALSNCANARARVHTTISGTIFPFFFSFLLFFLSRAAPKRPTSGNVKRTHKTSSTIATTILRRRQRRPNISNAQYTAPNSRALPREQTKLKLIKKKKK